MTYWRGLSAAEQGRAIGRGEFSPLWLAEDYLAAIHAHPQADLIYARLTEDRAMAEAHAAEQRARAGQRRSPLDGVPISWKDLFDSAGTATEAGSRLLAGRIPDRDAAVLAAATAQGLVCLGKTHMTELAFSGLGLNPMTATPPNVNDPAWAPGGSSSGAAASVAFDLAAAAAGSDTGGSVRIPSAWMNLVGLKTTHGRLPSAGTVPLVERFDTIGPLARTVEDAALMLAAFEGGRPADLRGAGLKGTRLLVLETLATEGTRPEPLAAFDGAVQRLKDAGASVEHGTFELLRTAMDLAGVLFTTEAWAIWRETIEAAPDLMYGPVRDRFRQGATTSGADFVDAWRTLRAIREDWAIAMMPYDAVLAPSSAILPPDAARLASDPAYFSSENLLALRNTRIGNLMGLCALTLPTPVPGCGLMLMGRALNEEALLRLGAAAEGPVAGR